MGSNYQGFLFWGIFFGIELNLAPTFFKQNGSVICLSSSKYEDFFLNKPIIRFKIKNTTSHFISITSYTFRFYIPPLIPVKGLTRGWYFEELWKRKNFSRSGLVVFIIKINLITSKSILIDWSMDNFEKNGGAYFQITIELSPVSIKSRLISW